MNGIQWQYFVMIISRLSLVTSMNTRLNIDFSGRIDFDCKSIYQTWWNHRADLCVTLEDCDVISCHLAKIQFSVRAKKKKKKVVLLNSIQFARAPEQVCMKTGS
jgi:hypothetical protein